jgi:hypothetical protein
MSSRIETNEIEHSALSSKTARHERWIKRAATKISLKYEEAA